MDQGTWSIKSNYKIIATIVAIILILIFSGLIFFPFKGGAERSIDMKIGSTLSQVASDLRSAGLIKSKPVFVFYVTALGRDEDVKAGKYNFSGRVSIHEVTSTLTGGFAEHDDVQVTIPEGMNIWEVDEVLAKSGLTHEGQLAKSFIHKEGHLFPDTYRFDKDATIEDIVNKMEENFR